MSDKNVSFLQTNAFHSIPTEKGIGKTKVNFQQTSVPNPKDQLVLFGEGIEKETQINSGKAENLFRWEHWKAIQSDSKPNEVSELKPVWNYLLGETGFSDLLSFIDPDSKESLQMIVEPKNKGLVLYVFWESKETGAMGIQFHYDPEKEKPVLVQLTTESSFQAMDLGKSFVTLTRDFPQIQSVQMDVWKKDSYNGDYR
ncbi:hypothetical protein [Leptospira harrisiae]|uniref:hypothetical protein n=1 Tax=Leptospira harrisiae TaxID=2023189 RepID=UPI001FAF5170|nr:hypothetical protein [Leptospira harrisiae]